MKPQLFENLRRFVSGGRKKKEKNESSFKRSDSFKRISIKRNYLERGRKHRQAALAAKVAPSTSSDVGKEKVDVNEKIPVVGVARAMGGARVIRDTSMPSLVTPAASTSPTTEGPETMVINYNQWLQGMSDKPPTPPVRKKNASLNGSVCSSLEATHLEKSPLPRPRALSPAPSRADSGLSINLGRIWMDVPMAMAPRSLELPRPLLSAPGTSKSPSRVHHSLDSALKESARSSRRWLSQTPNIVSRTLSSSTTNTNKSKDSGFSFSVSIPKLTDFSYSGGRSGFFRRKKKLSRPKPSVSRDGYFKRTSGANRILSEKVNSVKRSSSRKKGSKRVTQKPNNNEMYSVMVNWNTRSLRTQHSDSVVFVPPERRKPGAQVSRYVVREIRDYCVPRDLHSPILTDDEELPEEEKEEEDLYECIDDFALSEESDVGYIPPGFSPLPKRRPVKKKKSTRRNIKYVAKPGIHRAQSTLRRSKRGKRTGNLSYHIVS